ncbi:MAG: pyruvate kinase [Deltaproteobacteria bacterium]|nr:pyruvate kinase [Deltaproteobacteria bacterium]
MFDRRTTIVATLGPASTEPKTLERLIRAGLDVARINLSHGTHEEHRQRLRHVRTAAKRVGRTVGVLFDLQGPKIRIGRLRGGHPVRLARGGRFAITTCPVAGDATRVSTTYRHLPGDVQRGDSILLDDGRLRLLVDRVTGDTVHTVVQHGGWLGEKKGMNLPGVALSAPALTPKDYADLAFAIAEKADYLALSFVRSRRDILLLRRWLVARQAAIPIIAKIERREALDHLEEILEAADGVMVARGDLGVELSLARVPILQKTIIAQANRAARLVITATQMLESMIERPVPTRAEATDIANAIFDQTDAVMLSGETASGHYPVEAVRTMSTIIGEAEHSLFARPVVPTMTLAGDHSVTQLIVEGAAHAARDPRIRAIVAFTMTGTTVRRLAKQRPAKPILALTSNPKIAQRMALYWGVESFLARAGRTTETMIDLGLRVLRKAGRLRTGDQVILIAGTVHHMGATNMMKLVTV